MISRVLSGPGPAPEMTWHGLPPGAPPDSPLQIVYIAAPDPMGPQTAGVAIGAPIITADGAPVYATGPGAWGQLRAAGRT